MNRIYDNGALMLGNVQDIITEIERQIKEDIDLCMVDAEELLKDLKELRNIDYDMVVCINYDMGMGYGIDYWTSKDLVKNPCKHYALDIEKLIRSYIDDEKEYDSVKANKDGVLDYLNDLTDVQIMKMADNIVNDDWFGQQIIDTIGHELYKDFKGARD